MPSINALQRELAPRGFTALLISISEKRDVVAKAVREREYIVPVVLDPDGEVSQTYGVRGTPTTFLVSRDGKLLGGGVGPRPWQGRDGRELLDTLLRAEPAAAR